MLTEVFLSFFITSIIGLIIALARMAYKSKCKEVSFCCFKIIRDTETEEREMEFRALHHINSGDEENQISHPPTPINNLTVNNNR